MSSANTDQPWVTIGRISGVHGIRGNLKVLSYAESLELFSLEDGVILQYPQGEVTHTAITSVKPHGRKILVTVAGVNDRNQAEALVGSLIRIERRSLPPLEDDAFYWTDLIGCEVETSQARYVGRVQSIIAKGGNDVLVVRNEGKGNRAEVLIPIVESILKDVDLVARRLIVELPQGLSP